MSTTMKPMDPYTAVAESSALSLTPQAKIDGLKEIIKGTETAMLTTRSADGKFHSRAMNPTAPHDSTQLNMVFFGNAVSHKFDEIENDENVNVSFIDHKTTAWASISGKARVRKDKEFIESHWTSKTAQYFTNLKDGVHKGDSSDPRVRVIEVVPDEIRYWYPTKGTVGRATDMVTGAVTGHTPVSGELRNLRQEEILLTQGLHKT